ncbi:LIC10906 family membrane protein [Leptospira alstonii]|uniref:Membrane protein n=2 Tax=Leptospira alstonii TaxID=28452 RepID=T0HCS0_9LEPT|nr:histidine kinase N-terminal 7TM domain-containing protein [Leptospira alstonii]EMJ92697.1 putative membrane protein [Leptospira alstonii serovar Sichuan str. 79601]EQA81558.1 putative membrane protein [Leptospira alstonii serovar Pingchang str. 80-412]
MITYVAGFFILYLGIYVFRIPPRARVQKYFLGLCLMLSGWMIGFGMRMQVPIGIREIFANWILLPIPFISLFLDLVVCSIIGKKFKLNLYRTILIYILLPTFSLISLFGGYAKINGMSDYSFSPLFNYHLLMMFGFLSVIKSSLELGNAMIKKRGDKRIRSFLMLSGILISLLTILIFNYVLPLRSIFLGSYSAFGLLIFAILWSVAILHYDAFEIRELVMEGSSLPFLSRIFSFGVLGLYRIIDNHGYQLKLIASKANVTLNIVDTHYDVTIRHPSIDKAKRAEIVASIFSRRIR